MQRVRKHGGAFSCPRRCGECPDGAHHFCEIDMQPVFALDMSESDFAELDEDAQEEVTALRAHPAHLAGCESWYECRHCDAWIEASDDDDMEDDSPDSDDEPDSDDYDDEDDEDWDDEPDSEPLSDGVPLAVAMRGVLIDPPTNDDRTEEQQDVRSVSIPSWARDLARTVLFHARFLNWANTRVPNSIVDQWATVIAHWPADVSLKTRTWIFNEPSSRENAPAAVRALVDQANGGES
jgi:hypothetical protein